MMDERELDRAIDAAAGAMVAREPSRSLGHAVMARVREGDAPAPRRFVWMTAAASLVRVRRDRDCADESNFRDSTFAAAGRAAACRCSRRS